jgi:ketosteroid isomerase-like protein
MKKTSICLLGALLLMSSAWSQDMQNTGGTEKAVAALENQWLQSQKTNSVDLLVPLLADQFVDTGSDGKVADKAQTLATAKTTKWTSAEYEKLKVTVFGDVAIATGVFSGKGTDGSGKALDEHERWTDTWVKMSEGKWQCVASPGSNIKM